MRLIDIPFLRSLATCSAYLTCTVARQAQTIEKQPKRLLLETR